jgi:hypothetical protein
MPYQQIPRNRPIASLIKLYLDKKSGKVSDARKEIQKRFDYLDWKDQKRIILAFLQSGKSDREWAYGKIYRQWDDCYLEPLKALWERNHENVCAWSVIQHFPIEYVRENASQLEEVNGYYHLCQRLAEEPSYKINRSKLRDKEYLLVKLNTHREVTEDEAKDIFFRSLHDFCLTEPEWIFRVHRKSRGGAFSIEDIDFMNSLKYIFQFLGLDDVVRFVEDWNEHVMFTMYQGEELKNLGKEAISDDEYHVKRIAIGLKYIYLALDDKYKAPSDELPISKLNETVERIGKTQFWHKSGKPAPESDDFVNSPDAPKILEEMLSKNPAIGKLINSFSLAGQEEDRKEDLPF